MCPILADGLHSLAPNEDLSGTYCIAGGKQHIQGNEYNITTFNMNSGDKLIVGNGNEISISKTKLYDILKEGFTYSNIVDSVDIISGYSGRNVTNAITVIDTIALAGAGFAFSAAGTPFTPQQQIVVQWAKEYANIGSIRLGDAQALQSLAIDCRLDLKGRVAIDPPHSRPGSNSRVYHLHIPGGGHSIPIRGLYDDNNLFD